MATEEELLRDQIRQTYNSGDCARAVELACEFIKTHPKSHLARYSYAVMHGDFSYSPIHSPEEKARLMAIAKQGVSELLEDPHFSDWPSAFQSSVRNEYNWFFELHDKQYELGLERLRRGENGHYSACVGAAMMALKELKNAKREVSEDWAQRSLVHFAEFEVLEPDWYNINYFAAQALACLGRFDKALLCHGDMYRKQKNAVNEKEVAEFKNHLEEIRKWRTAAS